MRSKMELESQGPSGSELSPYGRSLGNVVGSDMRPVRVIKRRAGLAARRFHCVELGLL